jgi:hypothetical protein
MTDQINYLTHEGKAKLEAELRERETSIRREIAERINAAKELGDISESGEYEDAKRHLASTKAASKKLVKFSKITKSSKMSLVTSKRCASAAPSRSVLTVTPLMSHTALWVAPNQIQPKA